MGGDASMYSSLYGRDCSYRRKYYTHSETVLVRVKIEQAKIERVDIGKGKE